MKERAVVKTPAQLGAIFAARRKTRKLTQAEIATKLSVSQGIVSTLETHAEKLTLDRVLAIANMLGLEIVVQEKGAGAPETEW